MTATEASTKSSTHFLPGWLQDIAALLIVALLVWGGTNIVAAGNKLERLEERSVTTYQDLRRLETRFDRLSDRVNRYSQ